MGHFEFQLLDAEGLTSGPAQQVGTPDGVILLSHVKCDPENIRHLCNLAMQTPDYPHDICLWEGVDPNPFLRWSARIHWRIK